MTLSPTFLRLAIVGFASLAAACASPPPPMAPPPAPSQAAAAPSAAPRLALEGCANPGAVTGLPLPRPATTRGEASLRQGPAIQQPILFRIAAGTALSVTGECEQWRRVAVADGRAGWMHGALIRPAPAR